MSSAGLSRFAAGALSITAFLGIAACERKTPTTVSVPKQSSVPQSTVPDARPSVELQARLKAACARIEVAFRSEPEDVVAQSEQTSLAVGIGFFISHDGLFLTSAKLFDASARYRRTTATLAIGRAETPAPILHDIRVISPTNTNESAELLGCALGSSDIALLRVANAAPEAVLELLPNRPSSQDNVNWLVSLATADSASTPTHVLGPLRPELLSSIVFEQRRHTPSLVSASTTLLESKLASIGSPIVDDQGFLQGVVTESNTLTSTWSVTSHQAIRIDYARTFAWSQMKRDPSHRQFRPTSGQELMTACLTAKQGDEIHLGVGEFQLSEGTVLRVPAGVSLRGQHRDLSRITGVCVHVVVGTGDQHRRVATELTQEKLTLPPPNAGKDPFTEFADITLKNLPSSEHRDAAFEIASGAGAETYVHNVNLDLGTDSRRTPLLISGNSSPSISSLVFSTGNPPFGDVVITSSNGGTSTLLFTRLPHGIEVSHFATVRIEGCQFEGKASLLSSNMDASPHSVAILRNCRFTVPSDFLGGGLFAYDADLEIHDSTFRLRGDGDAEILLSFAGASNVHMSNCIFIGSESRIVCEGVGTEFRCESSQFSGVQVIGGRAAQLSLEDCRFTYHHDKDSTHAPRYRRISQGEGFALSVYDNGSSVRYSNCRFEALSRIVAIQVAGGATFSKGVPSKFVGCTEFEPE
jgi:hypothetical protein